MNFYNFAIDTGFIKCHGAFFILHGLLSKKLTEEKQEHSENSIPHQANFMRT